MPKRPPSLRTGWNTLGRVVIEVHGKSVTLTPSEARRVVAKLNEAIEQAAKKLPN